MGRFVIRHVWNRISLGVSVAGVLLLGVAGLARPASAAPILGLALEIDDSGSITPSNYVLQKTGYITALTALLPSDGSVALEVDQFSGTVQPVFALQTITPTTKASLLVALNAMIDHGGSTATGPAIQNAATNLLAFPGLTTRLIDVSTDGFGNVGINEGVASTNAVTAGINQVNVLCIGAVANCTFDRGIGSFDIPATFAEFQASLTTKLEREISVAEPSAIVPFGVALIGFGYVMSRRRAI